MHQRFGRNDSIWRRHQTRRHMVGGSFSLPHSHVAGGDGQSSSQIYHPRRGLCLERVCVETTGTRIASAAREARPETTMLRELFTDRSNVVVSAVYALIEAALVRPYLSVANDLSRNGCSLCVRASLITLK